MISHSKPTISAEDIAAVGAVLASGQLAHGPVAGELEDAWCAEVSMPFAAAVGSGTAALRLALLALGVEGNTQVALPAYSCVALLNAVLALGAEPLLCDVDRDTWTISVDDVAHRLTQRTKVIVAVHLFGASAPINDLTALGLATVEDCAHGVGGTCGRAPFGGAGTLSIASFYATKMIGVGEGGIVAGRDQDMMDVIRRARDYGDRLPDGRHLNDKMSEMEAVLALRQLRRLGKTLENRQSLAFRYHSALLELEEEGLIIRPHLSTHRIWYRYAVRLTQHNAADVCKTMAEGGVRAEQPVWDLRGCRWWTSDLRNTSEAFDRIVSLPLYPALSESELDFTVTNLVRCLRR
jgi:dTDP-4-amino-4,6-dideoxygalactose transaminase